MMKNYPIKFQRKKYRLKKADKIPLCMVLLSLCRDNFWANINIRKYLFWAYMPKDFF